MDLAALERDADAAASRGDYIGARNLLVQVTAADTTRFEPWLKLAAMNRAAGALPAALTAIERGLTLSPLDFSALLTRATLLDALGQKDAADEAFGRAIAQAPDPVPPQFAGILKVAQQRYGNWQDAQSNMLRSKVAAPSAKINAMIDFAVRRGPPDREGPTHYCYPGLPEIPFYHRDHFPWLAALEAKADQIMSEFVAVAAAQSAELVPYIRYPENVPLDQWEALNNNRNWTAIHLIERGIVTTANAQHCPSTMELLHSIPQPVIPGAGPNAMFSLLAPHTHIPPHTGIANTRLVCHLPLIVPSGCWFRVGNDRREWERGRGWVFDDTIEHEAMNPTNQVRVILIVDCWHPQLSDAERVDIAGLIGAGGQVHGL